MDDLTQALPRLPFKTVLSLRPLFARVRAHLGTGSGLTEAMTRNVLDMTSGHAPELLEPIEDMAVVARHEEAIRLLMGLIFSPATEDSRAGLAYRPFRFETLYATRRYRAIFEAPNTTVVYDRDASPGRLLREQLTSAYTLVLNSRYGHEVSHRPLVVWVHDESTGLQRAFRVKHRFDFVDIHFPADMAPMPAPELRLLLELGDIDALTARMPLDDVTFEGFTYADYHEVTEGETQSRLKSELLERGALTRAGCFDRIAQHIRNLVRMPDLEVGLIVRYPHPRDEALGLNVSQSLLADRDGLLDAMMRSPYGAMLRQREPVVVPDLLRHPTAASPIVRHLTEPAAARPALRSLALVPLGAGGAVYGTLELASPAPNAVNAIILKKLEQTLPALEQAVLNTIEDHTQRIETIIKRHCTAIHPSVEWRFVQAARRCLQSDDVAAVFEEIVFRDVVPLYGACDIRSSSTLRNTAIQRDLQDHLDLVQRTLAQLHAAHPLPVADFHNITIRHLRGLLDDGLDSGDELSVVEFIQNHVEPLLEDCHDHVPALAPIVRAYRADLNSDSGVFTRQRARFDASVERLNAVVAALVDEAEAEAQDIFPHYFERYKTDGIEYNIYLGSALVQNRPFKPVHLDNMRLWQLRLMCRVAQTTEALAPTLPLELHTTQLILVHSTPMTIRFRFDEKKFDVDGAYNVRYEILKKRIDKSTIKGTDARLTQPGTVAIVYTRDAERDAYMAYMKWLTEQGLISPDIEELALNPLQGAQGLKALRVTVRPLGA